MERIQRHTKTSNITVVVSMIIIGLLTAISGEIKVTPFDDMSLRFGFGSTIFFLALLVRNVPILQTGFITAIIVWLFRTSVTFFNTEVLLLFEYIPSASFYIFFAIGLEIVKIKQWRLHPIHLGLFGAIFELIANLVEHYLHILVLHESFLSPTEYVSLIWVAILRSFFVVGLYSALTLSEQKKRTEQLLAINTNLYVESMYIEKLMKNIESITADSFALYRKINKIDLELGLNALRVAQNIHEVKKDAQRISAGLFNLVKEEKVGQYELIELLHFVSEANKKYARKLNKNITFDLRWNENFYIKEHFSFLAIMNNIVANGIEAIETEGTIFISVHYNKDRTQFTIKNNGPKIDNKLIDVIFDPGYTTKFHSNGFASTGIGLSHVKTIIENLQGSIRVTSDDMTSFFIEIPTKNI